MGFKRSDVSTSNFLKKEDVASGRAFTIKNIQRETVKGNDGDEECVVVYFLGEEKAFILKPTNFDLISSFLGDDTDDWIGGQIELYNDTGVIYNNKRGGIRARRPHAAVAAAKATLVPSGPMTFKTALEAVKQASLSEKNFMDALKLHCAALNRKSWVPAEDTAFTLDWIKQASVVTEEDISGALGALPAQGEEDIPF